MKNGPVNTMKYAVVKGQQKKNKDRLVLKEYRKKKSKWHLQNQFKRPMKCYTCGLGNHTLIKYRYKEYKCKFFNVIGYLEKAYSNRQKIIFKK